METRLASLRQDIDRIDRQLADLLYQRFRLSEKIGILKEQTHIEVHVPERERQVLDRADRPESPFCAHVKQVFQCILHESSLIQKEK